MSIDSPPGPRRPDRGGHSSLRLKLVTAGAVVVVGLAGGVAVGANIGILDSSGDSGVGTLSAAGDLMPSTQVIDVYLPDDSVTTGDPTTTTASAADTSSTVPAAPASVPAPPTASGRTFTVDVAGTVTVADVDGAIQITTIAPAPGWTWQIQPGASADEATVTFADGTRTLHFVASRLADGTIGARVDEPVATAAPGGGTGGDDDHEDDDHEDDHDDDDHEDEEHEGGEDDD
jgi:hypothetical protein